MFVGSKNSPLTLLLGAILRTNKHTARRAFQSDNLTIHFEGSRQSRVAPSRSFWGLFFEPTNIRLYSMIPCCQKSLLSNETIVTCPHWATKNSKVTTSSS